MIQTEIHLVGKLLCTVGEQLGVGNVHRHDAVGHIIGRGGQAFQQKAQPGGDVLVSKHPGILAHLPQRPAKGGGRGRVHIFYSTRHIESSYRGKGDDKVMFETRGVLLHELTHAYQLEPQGIGSYGTNRTFWAFIEGMADAVRVANGGFYGEKDRPKGGHYTKGYRYAGYFFVWLRDHYDPDFLRKFNLSTLDIVPWSFDAAIKSVLGEQYDIESLWHEYQVAMGDIKE